MSTQIRKPHKAIMLDTVAQSSSAVFDVVRAWISRQTDSSTPLLPFIPKSGKSSYPVRNLLAYTQSKSSCYCSSFSTRHRGRLRGTCEYGTTPSRRMSRCTPKADRSISMISKRARRRQEESRLLFARNEPLGWMTVITTCTCPTRESA